MYGSTFFLVLSLLGLIPGMLSQLVTPSVSSINPLVTTRPSCSASNVMELCIHTNTEKQAGCVTFPDPRLCQCQYQHAVVTCYDLCKGDIGSTGSRPRAEGDIVTLCQGYNTSQIFPSQQSNPLAPSSAIPSSPSKATGGPGVSGVSNTATSVSLWTTEYCVDLIAMLTLFTSFVYLI
ncbi:hypothetical protein K7432_010008 [Basidiobolus ranarum]|uniref:Uncharacterized protein n=1 Tax=Basidiobolus ranarum TaxID=34480 RepID=A0ABR2WPF4_9FUNG